MATTVNVENIHPETQEEQIQSFFSFCGKIQSFSVNAGDNNTKTASITFEKPAAAKTALLLDNTELPGHSNLVKVSAAKSLDEIAGEKSISAEEAKDGDHHIEQEQKPRARIIAEYLAHGYAISDTAIEKALAADKQNGYSTKFMNTLNNFDQKTQATQRAQVVDQKFGVSNNAYAAFNVLTSYFDKAASTPTGQKLRAFYDQGNKTVMDVHNEARHLADLKKQKPNAEQMNVHTLPDSDKTQCDCGAQSGKCPCPEGKCACKGCGKAKAAGNDTEKSGAGSYAAAAAPTS
jgi:RNA recognition motif-containing protein